MNKYIEINKVFIKEGCENCNETAVWEFISKDAECFSCRMCVNRVLECFYFCTYGKKG